MSKQQINVDLNFRAKVNEAKQSMLELQNMLQKIASQDASVDVNPQKIAQASQAARELSIHLNNAFNADTGKFDLSKLDRSLKTSSSNITELSTKLLQAGAGGEEAFVKLAKTIAAADRPVITLNSKLNKRKRQRKMQQMKGHDRTTRPKKKKKEEEEEIGNLP